MQVRRMIALLPLLGALALVGNALAQDPGTGGAPPRPEGGAATEEAPATTTTTTTTSAPATSGGFDSGEFNRDLRTVEQETDRLKERVFRSKATLQLLHELVLEGSTLGSKLTLTHVNKMGPAYTLESIQYFLDGKNVYAQMDAGDGTLDGEREIAVFEQAVPPGQHNLQVSMVLRGNGFGVFSYLKTYSFKVQSSYSFTIEDGRETSVRVIANERGGPWRTFVDRPNVEYEETSDLLATEE